PQLSVVICTKDRPDKLKRAIASILHNSFHDFELMIVDQSGDERSRAVALATPDPRIRYFRLRSVGISISRNLAAQESRADIVASPDDDCVADPAWLQSLIDEYRRSPSATAVFGRVVPWGDGPPGTSCPVVFDQPERRVVVGPALPHVVLGHGNNMSF